MPQRAASDVPVKATATSLRVLEALKALDGAGVSELASELDLPNSTVHDHLKTLEADEYVVNEGGDYRVGARFLTLGGHVRDRMKIYRVGAPEVEELARETGEHANLMIEEHGMGVFLYIATGEDALHLDTYVGMRAYLHTTALGKAILANLPAERREAVLERHGLPELTERTITDREVLRERLDRIRDRGYAVDDGERIDGVRCVAAPVMGTDGDVLGAVSVSSARSRLRGDAFDADIPERVRRVANVIEVNATHG
jgi:DNA-binding IclR family transcriptional regulator